MVGCICLDERCSVELDKNWASQLKYYFVGRLKLKVSLYVLSSSG
jgi:hypothetical protein